MERRSPAVHVGLTWVAAHALSRLLRRLPAGRLRTARPYLMIVPAVALVSLLGIGMLDLFWKSIHSFDAFLREQGGLSLEQYRRLFTGPETNFYRSVLLRTLAMSITVTASAVVIALPVTYFIVRIPSKRLRTLVMVLVLVPFLLGEMMRTFGWFLLIGPQGALAWAVSTLGIEQFRVVGTLSAIWIGQLQMLLPIAILVMLPAVRSIEPDLERAAQVLGAPPRTVWVRIVAPLARPGMIGAAAVVFTLNMTAYAAPEILGAGTKPFAANVLEEIFFFQNNPYLGSAAGIAVLAVVTLIVVFLVGLGMRGGRSQ